MKTALSIKEDRFLINDSLVYSELPNCPPQYHGMLMNARFIQGVFDDRADPSRFDRFGRKFDPERNTADLIAALPAWYAHGLRAITVGFQGGGPCFTLDSNTIDNNPFSADGTQIDPAYLSRMESIIRAADDLGMVVIVSCFYGAQVRFLANDAAVEQAVSGVAAWIRDGGFTNVILEIANEHDGGWFSRLPILYKEEGVVRLIRLAQGICAAPVGCSGTGGYFSAAIAAASDVILVHGNGQSRQQYANLLRKARAIKPARPIVCNEDSQALSQMQVTFRENVGWGYYNNMTKQEPPADWSITKGEDRFFALRMAMALGITAELPEFEDQFYLQGVTADEGVGDRRWIRLASLYPEQIDHVDFYRDGTLYQTIYDDPFSVHFRANWQQDAVTDVQNGELWRAVITLRDGRTIEKTAKA